MSPLGDEERLAEDTLFLACTRPAMILGVPMEAMGLNIMITAIAFLAGNNLLYLMAAPVAHMVFAAICKHDPNAFRLLYLYVETKGRARNAALWGGNSASPLPLVRRRRPTELDRG